MRKFLHKSPEAGFALILTLLLLGLLVLAVYALSALVRVDGQVASASAYQTQARQNALLGLDLGLTELQRQTGEDAIVTGMAGLTGIPPNAANTTRHWCGVWRQADGAFLAWLASGAQPSGGAAVQPGLDRLELVGSNTVGASAANSEHTIAGRMPIVVSEIHGAPGRATRVGSYAWLAVDEGVKTPAYTPGPVPVTSPLIFSTSPTSAAGRLRDAIASYASNLPKALIYEQLKLLPTPGAPLTPSVLQDNFHHVTSTSWFVNGAQLQTGLVNVNTNSAIVWRNILQTYNTAPGAPAVISSGILSTRGTNLQNAIAAYAGPGKQPGGPFTASSGVRDFLSTLFTSASPTADDIMNIIGPMLAVRSDTFRLRAYGDAMNPVVSTQIEARAWCEAIVQRIVDSAPSGVGRKYRVVYFRWLGPNDI